MLKIKKKSGGGGANWMDTYGDMVTLLLCFFVLLYSMSTISQDKWKAIVMSFNPNAQFDQTEIIGGNDGPSSDAQPENADSDIEEVVMTQAQKEQFEAEMEEAMNNLYEAMKEYAEQSESAAEIELSKGDGYVFVSFNDAVFFGGDSYTLLPDGEAVLSDISTILNNAQEYIDEIQIMGHTAQASMDRPNRDVQDRLLSAERSAIAAAYIQMHSEIDKARIVSAGYGQWRPVASNEDEAGKSQNRRVEILVTGVDIFDELGDSLQQYNTIVQGAETITED